MKVLFGSKLLQLVDWLLAQVYAVKVWIGSKLLPLSDWMLARVELVPLSLVRMMFIGLLAALALWSLSLRPQLPGKDDREFVFLRDLRMFAILLLALQAIPYLIF